MNPLRNLSLKVVDPSTWNIATGFWKNPDGSYTNSTRIYRYTKIEGKPGDKDGPPGIKITLERVIIHGRYVSVGRNEKHQKTWYDPTEDKTIYLRRIK